MQTVATGLVVVLHLRQELSFYSSLLQKSFVVDGYIQKMDSFSEPELVARLGMDSPSGGVVPLVVVPSAAVSSAAVQLAA